MSQVISAAKPENKEYKYNTNVCVSYALIQFLVFLLLPYFRFTFVDLGEQYRGKE